MPKGKNVRCDPQAMQSQSIRLSIMDKHARCFALITLLGNHARHALGPPNFYVPFHTC